MKSLPQILFWLGLASIPLSWLLWYIGPEIEVVRPVLSSIKDPVLKAVQQEAHAERWGIFVGLWPVTLLVLSSVLERRAQD
jgi:low temperature requirement protein LtrA